MRTITCGICGSKQRLLGETLENKLNNFNRRSNIICKCKKCDGFLTIIRVKLNWKLRWLAPKDNDVDNLIDLLNSRR